MKIDPMTGELVNIETGKGSGVYAKKRGGRWYFRIGPGPKDRLIASGVSPAEFCKRFWFRDDYQEVTA